MSIEAAGAGPAVPITAELWRRVPVGRLRSEGLQAGERLARADLAASHLGERQKAAIRRRLPAYERGPGRPRISGNDLIAAAEAYLAAEDEGRSGRQAVAEAIGMSLSTADKWIRKARDEGLLPERRTEQ